MNNNIDRDRHVASSCLNFDPEQISFWRSNNHFTFSAFMTFLFPSVWHIVCSPCTCSPTCLVFVPQITLFLSMQPRAFHYAGPLSHLSLLLAPSRKLVFCLKPKPSRPLWKVQLYVGWEFVYSFFSWSGSKKHYSADGRSFFIIHFSVTSRSLGGCCVVHLPRILFCFLSFLACLSSFSSCTIPSHPSSHTGSWSSLLSFCY